jgi:cell division control protein 6
MERNTGIQGGQHYLFGLGADLDTTIDVLRENERLGDVMDRIVAS